MDKYKLDKMLKTVETEETFVNFLSELHREWLLVTEVESKNLSPKYTSLALGWENENLTKFLEAAASGGADQLKNETDKYNDNPWQRAAFIIYHGKFYE